MKANTALVFILSGIALWILQEDQINTNVRASGAILGLFVSLIGFLTLSEYIFGWDLYIDQIFVQEPATAVGTFTPGRMSPFTALETLRA